MKTLTTNNYSTLYIVVHTNIHAKTDRSRPLHNAALEAKQPTNPEDI